MTIIENQPCDAQLKKTLPKFASVEHTGDNVQPYAIIPQTIQDVSEWQDTFKPKTEH